MTTATVKVASTVGLHARPAATIARKAASFPEPITLQLGNGEPVDAASTLLVMMLGAQYGDDITISSADPDAVAAIAQLVQTDLDSADPTSAE